MQTFSPELSQFRFYLQENFLRGMSCVVFLPWFLRLLVAAMFSRVRDA